MMKIAIPGDYQNVGSENGGLVVLADRAETTVLKEARS